MKGLQDNFKCRVPYFQSQIPRLPIDENTSGLINGRRSRKQKIISYDRNEEYQIYKQNNKNKFSFHSQQKVGLLLRINCLIIYNKKV